MSFKEFLSDSLKKAAAESLNGIARTLSEDDSESFDERFSGEELYYNGNIVQCPKCGNRNDYVLYPESDSIIECMLCNYKMKLIFVSEDRGKRRLIINGYETVCPNCGNTDPEYLNAKDGVVFCSLCGTKYRYME